MRRLAGLICAALLAGAAAPVAAQSYCATYDLPERYQTKAFFAPMAYRLQTVGKTRVLIAEGAVMAGESDRLTAALTRFKPIDEVWMNSPGGVGMEGIKMGRVLRARGMLVRLPAQYACISSCSLAFLGGAVRIWDPGAYYGVHMFKGTDNAEIFKDVTVRLDAARKKYDGAAREGLAADEAARRYRGELIDALAPWQQDSAQAAAMRARYLVEMSASLDFLTDQFGTKAESVCFLSQQGVEHYNVANAK